MNTIPGERMHCPEHGDQDVVGLTTAFAQPGYRLQCGAFGYDIYWSHDVFLDPYPPRPPTASSPAARLRRKPRTTE